MCAGGAVVTILVAHSVHLTAALLFFLPPGPFSPLACPTNSLTLYVIFSWPRECSFFFGVGQLGWMKPPSSPVW